MMMDEHQRLVALTPDWSISPDEAIIQEQDAEINRLRTENEALRKERDGLQKVYSEFLNTSKQTTEALRKRIAQWESSYRELNARTNEFFTRAEQAEAQLATAREALTQISALYGTIDDAREMAFATIEQTSPGENA